MKKIYLLIIFILISNCSLKKVVQHHGVHNLEKKQSKLKVNQSKWKILINCAFGMQQ